MIIEFSIKMARAAGFTTAEAIIAAKLYYDERFTTEKDIQVAKRYYAVGFITADDN